MTNAMTDFIITFSGNDVTQKKFTGGFYQMTQLGKMPSKKRLFLRVGQPWLFIPQMQTQSFDFLCLFLDLAGETGFLAFLVIRARPEIHQ